MDDLKKVSHLLYAPGEVMPGIEMSLAEACARGSAAALFDEMPFCVVRDWIWIDLIVPDSIRETGAFLERAIPVMCLLARGFAKALSSQRC